MPNLIPKAGRHVDGDTMGQRHYGTDARNRDQASAYPHRLGQLPTYTAVQNTDLLAKCPFGPKRDVANWRIAKDFPTVPTALVPSHPACSRLRCEDVLLYPRAIGSLTARQIPKRKYVGGELPAVGLGDRTLPGRHDKPR
jgi:hypothetical protein